MQNKPENKVLLIIIDGFGHGKDYEGNAITRANTQTLDELERNFPSTLLKADSEAVGLPKNTMGGSEVGHYTIGCGQIIMQSLPYINKQIETGEFYENKALMQAIKNVKSKDSSLHLIGMISDAGVHSHIDHLYALIKLAKKHNLKKVYIHAITDGRDVPERSAQSFITEIEKVITSEQTGKITDLIGRFYAMDRDDNWERTETAYKLYTEKNAENENNFETTAAALTKFYNTSQESDYYLPANKIDNNNEGQITSNDSVIFFNYRTDRAKQLTDAFTLQEFPHFTRNLESLPYLVCFGEYSLVAPVAFPAPKAEINLGKIISQNGLKQLRIAETEKFPHVTFFFNSQEKEPYPGEERILIPSPKVPSYAEKPEMSAYEITEKLLPEISKEDYALIVLNFANLDLVGHSGDIKATIRATEVVDECLGQIIPLAQTHGYDIVITGDHGNADEMTYENGDPCPAHSMNPTQCFVISKRYPNYKLLEKNQGLSHITPTILDLLGLEKPTTITAESLIIHE